MLPCHLCRVVGLAFAIARAQGYLGHVGARRGAQQAAAPAQHRIYRASTAASYFALLLNTMECQESKSRESGSDFCPWAVTYLLYLPTVCTCVVWRVKSPMLAEAAHDVETHRTHRNSKEVEQRRI